MNPTTITHRKRSMGHFADYAATGFEGKLAETKDVHIRALKKLKNVNDVVAPVHMHIEQYVMNGHVPAVGFKELIGPKGSAECWPPPAIRYGSHLVSKGVGAPARPKSVLASIAEER